MRKMRKSFPLWVLFLVFTIIKLEAAAQSKPPQQNIDPKTIKQSISDALDIIKKNHVGGKNLNYADVFKWSITAALLTLDPYSTYYDAKEFSDLKTTPPNAGIGIKIQDHLIEGQRAIFIHAASQGSPAAKSGGLKFGDKIIKIDNWDAKGRSLAEVNEKLQGPRGSRVKVTIERGVDRQLQTIEVIRESFQQPPVPHAYMLETGVGYIDLGNGFKLDSGNEFVEKLRELHNKGMTALVLDLRDNTGGFLTDGIQVAREFLAEGRLMLTRSTREK